MLEEVHEGPYSSPAYTKEDKKIVANDWDEAMKPLKRKRGLSWYNRVGPLVVGVYLNMDTCSQNYYPEYSVHNLCREFNCLTATLRVNGGGISPDKHNDRYMEEAKKIREKAYIPIEGDLELDQIIAGYERYFEDIASVNYPGNFTEFEDLILICGWSRKKKKIEYALDVVHKILNSNAIWHSTLCWKRARYEEGQFVEGEYVEGLFDEVFKEWEESAWNGDKLNAIFESELKRHRLEKIPERRIIF